VKFTQRPIPAIGDKAATPEALVLAKATLKIMGAAPELRMLGREYVEAEAVGLDKVSPPVRAAAQGAFATLRAEAPGAAARVVGRILDVGAPRADLVRAAALLGSPEGAELVDAMAAAGEDDAKIQAAIGGWAEGHPRLVGELEPVINSIVQSENVANGSQAMETLRQELLPAYRADLCRRVICHPADAPKP
jgi:hypothetical protein